MLVLVLGMAQDQEPTNQPAGKVRGQLINFVSWLITDKSCADMVVDMQSGYA